MRNHKGLQQKKREKMAGLVLSFVLVFIYAEGWKDHEYLARLGIKCKMYPKQ